MVKLGPVQQKILIILLGGLSLGFSFSPSQSFRIIRLAKKEWERVSKQSVERSLRTLHKSGFISLKPIKDGEFEIVLSQKGKQKAIFYNLDSLRVKKPPKWDKKWRVVLFDIPEERREMRNVFRAWLKRLNFHKLQHSVFVHPYDCRNEFNILVEAYGAKEYVRFIVAEEIDNEIKLKKAFSL